MHFFPQFIHSLKSEILIIFCFDDKVEALLLRACLRLNRVVLNEGIKVAVFIDDGIRAHDRCDSQVATSCVTRHKKSVQNNTF